jgi:hypothetical protein
MRRAAIAGIVLGTFLALMTGAAATAQAEDHRPSEIRWPEPITVDAPSRPKPIL